MGLQQSKEELLYQQARYGNIEGIKALRQAGAGLEWIDREGRTPLILVCTKPDGLPVAKTLIALGADVNAYRPGYHAGTPLHHAAKKGLEQIVNLLLSHGANFSRVNDNCQTPLDLARTKGHLNVIRTIENHICLFSGWLRELSGPGFLEAFAPQWVSRKVWAVVLPCDHRNPMNLSKLELVVYPELQFMESPSILKANLVLQKKNQELCLLGVFSKAAQPRAIIPLRKAKIEEINIYQPDPVVYIFDQSTKARYKFLSANEGDKQQILWFYDACRGIPQQTAHPPSDPNIVTSAMPPSAPMAATEDAELAMAINASIQSAAAEAALHPPNTTPILQDTGGWGDTQTSTFGGWGPREGRPVSAQGTGGQADEPADTSYGGWAALGPSPGTSSNNQKSQHAPMPTTSSTQNFPASISAPASSPPTDEAFANGQVCYPSVDLSPVDAGNSLGTTAGPQAGKMGKSSGVSRTCVICLDAPVEGACIPCGHMAGCMSCLNEIKAKNWGCPVCRAKIDQVVRLYTV